MHTFLDPLYTPPETGGDDDDSAPAGSGAAAGGGGGGGGTPSRPAPVDARGAAIAAAVEGAGKLGTRPPPKEKEKAGGGLFGWGK